MLDIVVTHYEEPWDVGKKFFDMLGAQVGVDFDDIRVILVHDGTPIFPQCFFDVYPFTVEQFTPKHGGVSAARNFGLDQCKSKWVQICDFDDMFSNCFALKSVLDVLGTDDYDLLWGDFWSVDRGLDGRISISRRGINVVFVHAKIFRRKYLIENGFRFDTGLEFNEDCLFCTLIMETLTPNRIGHIETTFPFYTWCFSPKSATSTESNWWRATIGGYDRNRKVCEFFKEKKPDRYDAMFSRLVWDAYYSFNLEVLPDQLKAKLDDFREFYKENKDHFWYCDPEQMNEVREISKLQYETGEKEASHRWGNIPMKRRECVNIKEWLNGLESGVF